MTDDSVTNSNTLNGCFNKAVIVGEVVGSVVSVRENYKNAIAKLNESLESIVLRSVALAVEF